MTDITKLAQEILDNPEPFLSHALVEQALALAQAVIDRGPDLPEEPEEVKEALFHAKTLGAIRKAKAEQREKDAEICDMEAIMARGDQMYPDFCLDMIAEKAEEIAKAIRESKDD